MVDPIMLREYYLGVTCTKAPSASGDELSLPDQSHSLVPIWLLDQPAALR